MTLYVNIKSHFYVLFSFCIYIKNISRCSNLDEPTKCPSALHERLPDHHFFVTHLVNLSLFPAGWSFERTRGDQLPFKAVYGQDHPGYPRPQPLHFRDQAVGSWEQIEDSRSAESSPFRPGVWNAPLLPPYTNSSCIYRASCCRNDRVSHVLRLSHVGHYSCHHAERLGCRNDKNKWWNWNLE